MIRGMEYDDTGYGIDDTEYGIRWFGAVQCWNWKYKSRLDTWVGYRFRCDRESYYDTGTWFDLWYGIMNDRVPLTAARQSCTTKPGSGLRRPFVALITYAALAHSSAASESDRESWELLSLLLLRLLLLLRHRDVDRSKLRRRSCRASRAHREAASAKCASLAVMMRW